MAATVRHPQRGSDGEDPAHGALHYPGRGTMYPAKLVGGLAQAAKDLGATFHCGVQVLGPITGGPSPSTMGNRAPGGPRIVNTSDGRISVLKAVIVCTNGYGTPALLPELTDYIYPVRNQVLMTPPLPPLWDVSGICTHDDFTYAMQRCDGRVCIGGCRNIISGMEVGVSDDSVLVPAVGLALRKMLHERFGAPADVPVEHEWTGILGFTVDGSPLVGPLSDLADGLPADVFVAAGFCGHGMTVCPLVGAAVANMALGGAAAEGMTSSVHPYIQQTMSLRRLRQSTAIE